MSSSVYYKFRNQKDLSQINFDGTSISVFELKREIILAAGLGNGTDFDLHVYPTDDPTAELVDDTDLVVRTSSVIAARKPAPKGQGRAARYVSGKAPVRALNKKVESKIAVAPTGASTGPLSEQDAEAAFLAESAQVWDQNLTSLKDAKPTFSHHNKKKPVNAPAHDPPPGYVCYRCQQKGHWIQLCPTNNDPNFVPAARVKRTTGIPKSFLRTVEKPDEGDLEGAWMSNDGTWVRVLTDHKTWDRFQEKTKVIKEQAAKVEAANQELRERGLECPIDERLFINPVKTPCCGKTYCHRCIEDALVDGGLVCPNCSEDSVLIDDLVPDEEMVEKIRAYEIEKASERLDKEREAKEEAQAAAKPSTPSTNDEKVHVSTLTDEPNQSGSKSPGVASSNVPPSTNSKSPFTVAAQPAISTSTPNAGGNGSDTDTSTTSKKRKDAPTEIMAPRAPKAMRLQKEEQARQQQDQSSAIEKDFIQSMEALKNNVMPTSMGMNMPMNPMMGMMNPQMNSQNMNGMNGMNAMNGMNGMNPMGMGNMNGYGNMNGGNWGGYNGGYSNNMYGNNMGGYPNNMNNGYGNMGYNNSNGMNAMGGGYGWNGQNQQSYGNMGYQNQGMGMNNGNFPNQQRSAFSAEQPNQQDAYERKPLNPHRAQNKRKQRAPDFHYV